MSDFTIVGLNMCLPCIVNDTFSVEYWHDLEMWRDWHILQFRFLTVKSEKNNCELKQCFMQSHVCL